MTKYKVIIKTPSGELYEFEKASTIQWEQYENKPGIARFLLPESDFKLVASSLAVGKTQFLVFRDGALVWQGLVTVTEDNKEGTFVYGLGLLEVLKWYQIGKDVIYTNKKIGSEFLSPIWNAIAARSNTAFGTLLTKGTIEDPYTTGTATPKTISKTTFDENFYETVEEMVALSRSDSPSGAWEQNTVFDVTLSETTPTFRFRRNVGVDKPDVRLELDSEITDFTFIDDARDLANTVIGYTVTSNPSVLNSPQTDTTSQTTYYRREFSPVFETLDKQNALDERAKDFLKEFKEPKEIVLAEYAAGLEPFDGYDMGDNVKILINRGRVNVDKFYRVIGMRVLFQAGVEVSVPILQEKRT